MRFDVEVEYVYKTTSTSPVVLGLNQIYVLDDDLHCKCPKLRVGKKYFMIGVSGGSSIDNKNRLILDKESIVVRFKKEYDKRVRHYSKEERKQSCYRLI